MNINIKWLGLVAAMAVFSVGCSDKDQDADQGYSSNETSSAVQTEQENISDSVDDSVQAESNVSTEPKKLNTGSGVPPEKLDKEVEQLVEELTEGHEGADAEKLEQDIKGVLKQIDVEKTQ